MAGGATYVYCKALSDFLFKRGVSWVEMDWRPPAPRSGLSPSEMTGLWHHEAEIGLVVNLREVMNSDLLLFENMPINQSTSVLYGSDPDCVLLDRNAHFTHCKLWK